MWFRLRLSPTHEFSAFLSCGPFNRCELYWNHLDVVKHYPNHRTYPLTTVGRCTNAFELYRFTDDYLNHPILYDEDFQSLLRDQDPTLYEKLIYVFQQNPPIQIVPGLQDNFSWKKCICVEPCATGKWRFEDFFKEYQDFRSEVMFGSSTSRFDAAGLNEEEWPQKVKGETPPEPQCHCQVEVVHGGVELSGKALEESMARRRGWKIGEHHAKPQRQPKNILPYPLLTHPPEIKVSNSIPDLFGFASIVRSLNNVPEEESVEEFNVEEALSIEEVLPE